MSEEALNLIDAPEPEAAAAPGQTQPSATEEAAGILDEAPVADDEPSFLDRIDAELGGMDLDGGSDEVPIEPEPESDDTEGDPTAEGAGGDEDLVSEFPEADALKEQGTLDEKAAAKWGELRSELAEERAKARELEAKLDETAKQSVAAELETQLEDARAKIAEYEQEISVARVEQSAEYREVVTEPLQNIMDRVEDIAAASATEETPMELIRDRVYDALAETQNIARQNQILDEVTEGMNERSKIAIFRMVDDAAAIFAKDEQLKANAAEAAVELEQRAQVQEIEAAKRSAAETRRAVGKVYDRLEGIIPDLGEGVDIGKLRDKTLQDDFVKLGAEHKAFALSSATMLPPLVKAVRARDARITELEGQLASYRKSTPKAAPGGAGVAPSPGASESDLKKGFLDSIGDRLGPL